MSHEQQPSFLGGAALSPAAIAHTSAAPLRRSTAPNCSAGIARLCGMLDAAFEAAGEVAEPSHCAQFVRLVRASLAQAAADETLLAPAQREGSPEGYRRHLLAADPSGRYAVVALVWQSGQASPIHAHHAWCGYAVVSGTLTETLYDWNESLGCATYARAQVRAPGAVACTRAGAGGIHRLSNIDTDKAVSLHVYGVAGEQVATHVNETVRVAASAPVASRAPSAPDTSAR